MTKDLYCQKCGAKLIVTHQSPMGYDIITGLQEFATLFQCPNRKWYNFFHTEFALTIRKKII